MQSIILNIEGMHCNNCVNSITKVLQQLDGVQAVNVDLANKQASIDYTAEVNPQQLIEAIENAGFYASR